MHANEARAAWAQDAALREEQGIYLPDVRTYTPDEWRRNAGLAMDAQPSLIGTPNSGIPALLTTSIDPKVFEILLAPNRASEIIPEVRVGTWTDQTRLFPTVERTGEVSSYGDFATSGRASVNAYWPERQSYLFQTFGEWGELEIERAGLALVNWVSEVEIAAVTVLKKFQNLSYFYGVGGLLNYGLLNDPALNAALTPGTKFAGNANRWVTSAGVINATSNELITDIQSLFIALVNQSNGLISLDDELILACSPVSETALTSVNMYGVSAFDLVKKTFPKLKIVTAVQYGAVTSSNPQGNAAGALVQLIAPVVENQEVGFAAFNEKLRAHKIIQAESSWRQKKTAGTWGAVLRQPFAISQMLGV
jgi:hypothetical protein